MRGEGETSDSIETEGSCRRSGHALRNIPRVNYERPLYEYEYNGSDGSDGSDDSDEEEETEEVESFDDLDMHGNDTYEGSINLDDINEVIKKEQPFHCAQPSRTGNGPQAYSYDTSGSGGNDHYVQPFGFGSQVYPRHTSGSAVNDHASRSFGIVDRLQGCSEYTSGSGVSSQ